MVLFDAGILIKLLDARTPDAQREKLDYLIATLQKTKTKILIPTPALSDFMSRQTLMLWQISKASLRLLLHLSTRRQRWNVLLVLQMPFAQATRRQRSQMPPGRR
jgi:hypothetical protein